MASLGVLASLMTNQYPDIKTFDPMDVARLTSQRTANQTNLLALEDLKRSQQAEAAYRQAVQQNPGLLFGGGGQQPMLSQLSPGGAPAGGPPGAITQTPLPGMPGQAQTVQAPMDLSRFATGPPPPGAPVLASVGQPQAPMGSAQATLMQLARQNPGAALLLQGRMQQQEELGYKRQEQGLKIREKVAESFGQLLGGAHDQASYDVIRRQLAQVSPQWAAALPQVYSQEGVQPFIDAAISAKDRATLGIQHVEAQAAMMKARREQANIPNYTGDAQLDALIYKSMKGQPAGTMPSEEIVGAAYREREADKLRVSREQGMVAAEIERTEKPLEGEAATAVSDLTTLRTMTDDIAALRTDAFTGPVVGRTGYLREQAGKMTPEEVAFRSTVKDVNDILSRLRSGAAIPPDDMRRLEALAPSVNDHPAVFVSKLQRFQRALEQQRESRLRVGTTSRARLREETTPTTPRVGAQPPLKPVGDMTTDELKAERDRLRASGGR